MDMEESIGVTPQGGLVETIWKNPTDSVVALDLADLDGPGIRKYRIPAGQERALPSRYDGLIHVLACREKACAHRKLACRNGDHDHWVVGGLSPDLIAIRRQTMSPDQIRVA